MGFLKGFFNRLQKLPNVAKVVLLLVILGVGFYGGIRILNQKSSQPAYQTAQAEKGSLISSVTASGNVAQGSSVNITTQASGIVNQVYVSDGEVVSAGQKIADLTLDTQSQQKQTAAWAAYLSAKNNLDSANNQLNTLQASLFQANQKLINDAVAQDLPADNPTYIQEDATWKAAEGAYKNQQTAIAQSQASLSSAWLSYIQLSPTVTAPSAGTISGLNLTAGQAITASSSSSTTNNTSTTLGTITLENGTPQAKVNLTEIDVVKVKVGQKATLTMDAFPDKTFTGRVSAIDTNGTVASGVTNYPATITFDTALSDVYPNMAVNATIITNLKSNVILVPTASIQNINGTQTVRVLRNNQEVDLPVEIGDSNDTQTEIISGVSEGETVITGQTSSSSSGSGVTSPFGNTRGGFGSGGGFGGAVFRGRGG